MERNGEIVRQGQAAGTEAGGERNIGGIGNGGIGKGGTGDCGGVGGGGDGGGGQSVGDQSGAGTSGAGRNDDSVDGGGERRDDAAWDAARRQLRAMRMERGIAVADTQWVEHPFRMWLNNLDCSNRALSFDAVSALAVGMAESLAIRDALIVSLVTERGVCDEERMVAFASHPHDPRNVARMYRMLQRAFDDADAVLDRDRCRTGLVMMRGICEAAPKALQIQPLAVMGYIHWWMGDDDGLPYALEALGRDATCTLASIVRSAYEHGIRPANARQRIT